MLTEVLENEIELIWTEDGKGDIREPSQSGKGDGFHIDLTSSGIKKCIEAQVTGKLLRLNVALAPQAFRIHCPDLFAEDKAPALAGT